MKKRNILYGIMIAVVFALTACDLDRIPEDTLSPQTYFSSENELRLWTNYFYSQLDSPNSLAGQNADDNIDSSLGEVMDGQRSASDEGGWNWSMLRSINYYLQHSHQCKDEKAREHYDGVAYFMRAYFYFVKVRRYGDVPWYNQVLGSADEELLFKARQDREIIMDSVMNDLDRAIAMLPENKTMETVNKWTALALKSRAALYEGTFRKYHGLPNSEKFLQHAAQAGDEFISSGKYSLFTQGNEPYRSLFNDDAKVNDASSEIILWQVFSTSANLMNSIQFNIANSRQAFTRNFMNHYLMADGSRFQDLDGWQTMQFVEEVTNRDSRLAQTVLTPGYVQKGTNAAVPNLITSYTGYQPIKFVAGPDYDGSNKGITNWPLFRSAEVFLNFAEAKAELGTLTQADLDKSINVIRTRANMPSIDLATANSNIDPWLLSYYPNVTKSSNTGVILEIRRERTIELVMEGFRQWDLLRWKEGANFTKPFHGVYFAGTGTYDMDGDGTPDILIYEDTAEDFSGRRLKLGSDIVLTEGTSGYVLALSETTLNWVETRDYLWPIPANQRQLTEGKLTQNNGWDDGLPY